METLEWIEKQLDSIDKRLFMFGTNYESIIFQVLMLLEMKAFILKKDEMFVKDLVREYTNYYYPHNGCIHLVDIINNLKKDKDEVVIRHTIYELRKRFTEK